MCCLASIVAAVSQTLLIPNLCLRSVGIIALKGNYHTALTLCLSLQRWLIISDIVKQLYPISFPLFLLLKHKYSVPAFILVKLKWKVSLSFEFLSNLHLNDFTLAACVAEDMKKCCVECEVVWMSGFRESCKQQNLRPSNRPKGYCTSLFNVTNNVLQSMMNLVYLIQKHIF